MQQRRYAVGATRREANREIVGRTYEQRDLRVEGVFTNLVEVLEATGDVEFGDLADRDTDLTKESRRRQLAGPVVRSEDEVEVTGGERRVDEETTVVDSLLDTNGKTDGTRARIEEVAARDDFGNALTVVDDARRTTEQPGVELRRVTKLEAFGTERTITAPDGAAERVEEVALTSAEVAARSRVGRIALTRMPPAGSHSGPP